MKRTEMRNEKLQKDPGKPTPIEALFLEAGLPATEVEACPDERCPICRAGVPRAA